MLLFSWKYPLGKDSHSMELLISHFGLISVVLFEILAKIFLMITLNL